MLKRIVTLAAVSISTAVVVGGAAYVATLASMAGILATLEDQVNDDRMTAIASVVGVQTGVVTGVIAGAAAGVAAASGRRRPQVHAPLDANQVLLKLLSEQRMPEGMTSSQVLSTIEAIALAQASSRLPQSAPVAQPSEATTDQRTKVNA
ncbi:hypothetical protein H6F43_03635 [Leptolyngbya sp. FACHB-36]|uniref:hypothetical protein n=1 Tax=Leptolyngbya sp. FACHB-36 TaxID=2692808 RepID=UPI0016808E34|nr:hypothetical protein [Leptolyngbya sp. FACHB-36]MBD2019273.1 hypothetical protein [Leptolyngbya sp. FACHB-36]